MEFIYLVIGMAIGAVVVWLLANNKKKEVESTLMLTAQKLTTEQTSGEELRQKLEAALRGIKELEEQLLTARLSQERLDTQLKAEQDQNSKETKLRQEQFQEQLRTVQEQFSNLASRVLSQASSQLKTTNQEAMEHVTAPLKENLEQLQQAIRATNQETAKNTASLSEQLKSMSEQTQKIGQTATRLTNVIRGGNKAQGNWGERMLTDILEAQGFRIGFDYDVQESIVDEGSGQRLIPDVILHYPNNEDVVIDSKMSIDAYYQYVNTEDEGLKRKFADDLVKSIRTQAVNLGKKDYSRYIKKPRRAIDFVIMFVPNEGALQLALAHEPRIWSEAFERQVFITSQQNLMAILKIIQIAWRQYAQTESQKKVFDMAEEMMKRVGEFIKRFDKVGKDLDTLRKDYDDAYNKAYTGRQSIVQKANELKELGVKESPNQPIPPVEAALPEGA